MLLLLVTIALSVASTGSVLAQGLNLLSGGSDPGAGTLVSRRTVEIAAEASYVEALVARGEQAMKRAGAVPENFFLGPYVVEAQRSFEAALSTRLDELHADGVLTLAEVIDSLPEVRQWELDRFADAIEARSAGFIPPPLQEDFDGYAAFAVATFHYVLLVRNSPNDWLWLVAFIAGGLAAAMLVSTALASIARRGDHSSHHGIYRSVTAIRVPLLLTAATIGALFGLDAVWAPSAVANGAKNTLATLILLFLFWACWNICAPVSGWLSSVARRVSNAEISNTGRLVVTRVLRLALIVVVVLIATKLVLGASLTAILAGLGVAGVVLWFLLQGLIENLAASFTLFGDQSISVGDTLIYKDQWGTIEDIGFRTTQFRTFDGHVITIPNSNMISDSVENVSRRLTIRRRFHLGIAYDTPASKIAEAIDIVRIAIESKGKRITGSHDVNVVLQNFSSSSLQLLIQYFAATTDYWEAEVLHDQINREILKQFSDNDITIPFPTHTTILRTDEGQPTQIRLDNCKAVTATED